jgi:hypothetical protein
MKDSAGGGIYGLGFLGALFFFIRNADSVGAFLLGLMHALFWPAVLVYELFQFLA